LDRFIEESPHNTQIARMFRLKAEAPEKYREDIKPQSYDASRELLDRLTEVARKEIEERRKLEEGATEGSPGIWGSRDRGRSRVAPGASLGNRSPTFIISSSLKQLLTTRLGGCSFLPTPPPLKSYSCSAARKSKAVLIPSGGSFGVLL
jgi:hypothetical protein